MPPNNPQDWRTSTPGVWLLGSGTAQGGPTVDYTHYRSLKVEKHEGILVLSMNRPETGNIIDGPFHTELEHIWLDIAQDREVRVVVFTGIGEDFCAGADLSFVESLSSNRSQLDAVMREAAQLIRNMLKVPQPIIAAVNGDALSLGVTMVLFCDVIVAAENANLADTHVKYGIVAGDGGAVIWPLLIGMAKAKEFLMTGRPVSGADAERIGLINYAVPTAQVMGKATELARELASGPVKAVQGTKRSLNRALTQRVDLILDTSLSLESETLWELGKNA